MLGYIYIYRLVLGPLSQFLRCILSNITRPFHPVYLTDCALIHLFIGDNTFTGNTSRLCSILIHEPYGHGAALR